MRHGDHTPGPERVPAQGMVHERLDAWLPDAQVRTHHRRTARADPAALWAAASGVRLSDTRGLGRLVRWRIPGLDPRLTYHEMFRAYPFTVLEEGEGRLLSGLCGRIWTLARDYPPLGGAEDFAAWAEPGTVRVLFAHWVEPAAEGAQLFSEARVQPTDRVGSVRMRALWRVIGPFERLVATEPLTIATRLAEREVSAR
jgi:hypothetical protein